MGSFVSFHTQRGRPGLASVFCQDDNGYVAPAVSDSTYTVVSTEPNLAATAPESQVKHGSYETSGKKTRDQKQSEAPVKA